MSLMALGDSISVYVRFLSKYMYLSFPIISYFDLSVVVGALPMGWGGGGGQKKKKKISHKYYQDTTLL